MTSTAALSADASTGDQSAPDAAATIRVLRSPEAVRAARLAWDRLPPRHVEADLDYFLSVVASRPEVIRPHVVLLERDGEPEGLLVGRLEERALPARFGYATVWKPKVRCITIVHDGAVGPAPAVRAMAGALLDSLADREADVALLHRVAVDSALYLEASTRSRAICRERFTVATRHWAADLPDSFEAFQKGLPKSLRGNVRRDGRKLLEAYGQRLEILRLQTEADLERVLSDVEHVARTTYQRGLGAGFSADGDGPQVRLALQRGWFNAWVMYIDGVPCAYEVGHVYGGTFFSAAKGFDPAYGRHNVGTFLQMRMFEDLCADPAVREVDFGFGDADYKRRCATRGWDETDFAVYAPALRPIVVATVRNAVTGADQAARRLAGKERIARVKRRWRDLRTPG